MRRSRIPHSAWRLGRPILLDVGVEASVEMSVESDLTAAPHASVQAERALEIGCRYRTFTRTREIDDRFETVGSHPPLRGRGHLHGLGYEPSKKEYRAKVGLQLRYVSFDVAKYGKAFDVSIALHFDFLPPFDFPVWPGARIPAEMCGQLCAFQRLVRSHSGSQYYECGETEAAAAILVFFLHKLVSREFAPYLRSMTTIQFGTSSACWQRSSATSTIIRERRYCTASRSCLL